MWQKIARIAQLPDTDVRNKLFAQWNPLEVHSQKKKKWLNPKITQQPCSTLPSGSSMQHFCMHVLQNKKINLKSWLVHSAKISRKGEKLKKGNTHRKRRNKNKDTTRTNEKNNIWAYRFETSAKKPATVKHIPFSWSSNANVTWFQLLSLTLTKSRNCIKADCKRLIEPMCAFFSSPCHSTRQKALAQHDIESNAISFRIHQTQFNSLAKTKKQQIRNEEKKREKNKQKQNHGV